MAKYKCPMPSQCVDGPGAHSHNRKKAVNRAALTKELTEALNVTMRRVAKKHGVKLVNLTYDCDIARYQ